ncbi:hypothetical protein H2201_008239 [Coniosporium apollinis]|uniref:Uncharacterized protein n=1 Tax=Coniosporium apollinis TaxID=61459 RepID=A0ABQ9NHG9_9PEZI|nr:hypothetical protein H2201_008239 [Coniosporium apollinis]
MFTAIRMRIGGQGLDADSGKLKWAAEWRGMNHGADFQAVPQVAEVPILPGKGYGKLRKPVVPATTTNIGYDDVAPGETNPRI